MSEVKSAFSASSEGLWAVLVALLSLQMSCLGAFRVNETTANNQTDVQMASNSSNRTVAVWVSNGQSGGRKAIYGQIYDFRCQPIGGEFQVCNESEGDQSAPAVSIGPNGGFIVAWQGENPIYEDIFARRFDANAAPKGDQFQVNTYYGEPQLSPAISINASGRFVIAWESMNVPSDPAKRAICGRIFESNGVAAGDEMVLSDIPAMWRLPAVVMFDNGGFSGAWVQDSTTVSVWTKRFAADGSSKNAALKVNSNFELTSLTQPALSAFEDGTLVVCWDGHYDSYVNDDIWIRSYSPLNAPLSDPQLVNFSQSGLQFNPAIVLYDDKRVIVTWESRETTAGLSKLFSQSLVWNDGGYFCRANDLRQLTGNGTGTHERPSVCKIPGAHIAVAWHSKPQDTGNYDVVADCSLRFEPTELNADYTINLFDFSLMANNWQRHGNGLIGDINVDGAVDVGDISELAGRWLYDEYDIVYCNINDDSNVNLRDYAIIAAGWKGKEDLQGDIVRDGFVNEKDLLILTSHWLDN